MKASNSKSRVYFWRSLNTIVFFCIGIFVLFVCLALVCLAELNMHQSLSAYWIWAIIIAISLIFIGVMALFYFKVYRPVVALEKALRVVSNIQDISEYELKIPPNSQLYNTSAYINKMIQRLKESANREYTASLLVKQAELDALQMQINPHFLYNTLDSIRGLALVEGQTGIADMTKALSNIFRYSTSKKEDYATIREEIKNAENYIKIQQIRFSNKFDFVKQIDPDDEAEIMNCLVPKLTIQPIVENAVFHGLETKVGTGTITLKAYLTERRLVVAIADDGVGMDQQTLENLNRMFSEPERVAMNQRNSSIALANVNERIKLFLGNDYGVRIMSTPDLGTTVEISLPVKKA